jgi:hypothetical protein
MVSHTNRKGLMLSTIPNSAASDLNIRILYFSSIKQLEKGGLMVITDANRKLSLTILAFMVAMIVAIAGCSSLTKKDKQATAPSSGEQASGGVSARYYDFGDVLVPKELKVDKKSSFIYQTDGFSAGVLVLKGRIETSSLIDFFENNMAKDNWKNISTFKSERTMLLFQKANRWCVMNITDETFNTYVEIWVAPTTKAIDAGLLK